MYLIEWIENGEKKTFVCEGYIERDSMMDDLIEKGFDPTWIAI